MNTLPRLSNIAALVLSSTLFILASSATPIQSEPEQLVSVRFPSVAVRNAPPRTSNGAGSAAGSCLDVRNTSPEDHKHKLTAIVPENNVITTVAPNPSIYIYVPQVNDFYTQEQTDHKDVEFLFIDPESATEIIYERVLTLPNTAAIIKLTIPETVALNLNRTQPYKWYFSVICDPYDRSADEGIEGWLERITLSPEPAAKIEQAREQPLEQAQLYAEAGIWQETLDLLAQGRERYPQAEAEWQELLESVGLGEFASYPIIDCSSNFQTP